MKANAPKAPPAPLRPVSRSGSFWSRLSSFRSTWVGLVILGSLLLVALFADLLASDLPLLMSYKGKLYVLPNLLRPVELRGEDNQSLRKEFEEQDWAVWPLVPYGPDQTQPGGELDMSAPPGALHPLGTDPVGRDVAARLIHGVRPALAVGVSAVVLSVALGFFLGGLAGYFAGPADWLVSWAVAVTLTFPAFLLVLSLQGLAALRTWWGLAFILGLVGWAPVARLVRGQTRRASASEFVLAARASGASHLRILVRHVLPNATGPVIVMAAFGVGWAILMESALSFLGVGPSTASWGQLLASARLDPQAWWLTLTGGSAIFLTVLATNLLAEASRRALSPRGSETWRT